MRQYNKKPEKHITRDFFEAIRQLVAFLFLFI
jgi:hypothetical protein